MPNRREFLQTGAVVSAIAANGVIVHSAHAVGANAPIALGSALYDDRYAEGRRFAAVAGGRGVATRPLDDGDVTRSYEELEQLWRREPAAIAGFTQFGPMFVIERLALERGMRLALRVEHCAARPDALAHRLTGPRDTLALAAGFDALHADWPGLMATIAFHVAHDDSPQRFSEIATPGLALPAREPRAAPLAPFVHYYAPHAEQQGHGPALDGPLYSWVVAPPLERG